MNLKITDRHLRKILQNVYVKDLLDVTISILGNDVLIVTVHLNYHFSMLPEVSFKISTFTKWNMFLSENLQVLLYIYILKNRD